MRRRTLGRCTCCDAHADDKFWINAAKVEALVGLGRQAEASALRETISAGAATWMLESMATQLAKLEALNPLT